MNISEIDNDNSILNINSKILLRYIAENFRNCSLLYECDKTLRSKKEYSLFELYIAIIYALKNENSKILILSNYSNYLLENQNGYGNTISNQYSFELKRFLNQNNFNSLITPHDNSFQFSNNSYIHFIKYGDSEMETRTYNLIVNSYYSKTFIDKHFKYNNIFSSIILRPINKKIKYIDFRNVNNYVRGIKIKDIKHGL
jgi:hypothetical protein